MFRNVSFKPERTTFEIHNMDLSIVNAIRRLILTDIPTVGFRGEEHGTVEIVKNTGPLHNEFIMHRIGLIPLHFNEEQTEAFEEDQYEFELFAENKAAALLNVTTKDFKIRKNGKELTVKEAAAILPANPVSKQHILITRLRTGEMLHLKAKPVVDVARHHSGFSPVSLCTFSFMPDAMLAAKATNILDKERAYARNDHGDPTAFTFQLETESGLSAFYLVSKALEILRTKLDKTVVELYAEPSSYVTVAPSEKGVGFEFTFQNEDDSYGHVLQSLMYNHYLREQKPTVHGKKVSYVGYVCPHPLESVMVMHLVIEDSTSLSDHIEAFAEQCRHISAEIQQIHSEWLRVNKE